MKVKNIMFSGAMASILMIGGAYAADGDNPKLATDAYVKSAYNAAVNKAVSNVKGGDGVSISYGTGTGAAKDATIAIDTSVIATVEGMNTELAKKQNALPAMTDKAGKVLKVNSNGTGLEWADDIDTDTNTQVELLTTTGSSTTAGMTQNAITTALGTKQDTLTAAQLLAVNSGIDASKVATYNGYADQIAAKADASALDAKANSADVYTKTETNSAISIAVSTKANSADVYTKTETDAALELKADASDLSTLETTVAGKQAALSDAQMLAVNSGIDATKVAAYDAYATGKQDALGTEQLAAVNSGITSTKVAAYDGYATAIDGKADADDLDALTEKVGDATKGLVKSVADNSTAIADLQGDVSDLETSVAGKQDGLTATNGINIDTDNNISVKVDTTTIKFNANGQVSLGYEVTGDDFSGD